MTQPGAQSLDNLYERLNRLAAAAGVDLDTWLTLRDALYSVVANITPSVFNVLVNLPGEIELRAGPAAVQQGRPVFARIKDEA